MGEKIDWTNKGPSVSETLQPQLDAFKQWAHIVEQRMFQMQNGLLNLVGSLDGLVGLLIAGAPVTEEAIAEKRMEFLRQVASAQEEARKAQEEKSSLYVPDKKIVVP